MGAVLAEDQFESLLGSGRGYIESRPAIADCPVGFTEHRRNDTSVANSHTEALAVIAAYTGPGARATAERLVASLCAYHGNPYFGGEYLQRRGLGAHDNVLYTRVSDTEDVMHIFPDGHLHPTGLINNLTGRGQLQSVCGIALDRDADPYAFAPIPASGWRDGQPSNLSRRRLRCPECEVAASDFSDCLPRGAEQLPQLVAADFQARMLPVIQDAVDDIARRRTPPYADRVAATLHKTYSLLVKDFVAGRLAECGRVAAIGTMTRATGREPDRHRQASALLERNEPAAFDDALTARDWRALLDEGRTEELPQLTLDLLIQRL